MGSHLNDLQPGYPLGEVSIVSKVAGWGGDQKIIFELYALVAVYRYVDILFIIARSYYILSLW